MIKKSIKEKLYHLPGDHMDDFRDELLSLISEEEMDMNDQERAALLRFAKGHSNSYLVSTVLDIAAKANPQFTKSIALEYSAIKAEPEEKLEIKREFKVKFEAEKPKITVPEIEVKPELTIDTHVPIQPKNLLTRLGSLSNDIKEDFIDDILSILSKDEIKRLNLSPQEKQDINKLLKGHYNPRSLFNALQVAIRAIDETKWMPGKVVPRKVDRDIRFGVELVPATGLDKIVDYSRKFEMGGMDTVWITDHYNNMDPYVTLTLIARATNTAHLGVGVTNPYIRHLSATAQSIASLDMISNGRMMLGMGAGDKSTLASLNIGMKKALTTVRETVSAIRSLWTKDTVNFDGEIIKLDNARFNFRPKREIPIYVGAQGPKMLQLAGEIGNGVLINASHPLDFKIANKMIQKGVNKANRKMEEVDVTAYTSFSVADNKKDAFKAAVPVVAFIAAATPPQVLERHDLNIEIAQQVRNQLSKGNMAGGFSLIDDKYVEAFAIGGTPKDCISKIEELHNAGVTQFVFGSPLGPKKKQATQLIIDQILSVYN